MTMAWTKGLALGLLVGATGCIVSIGDDDDDRGGRGGSLGVAGRGGTGGTGGSSAGTGGSGGDASGGTGGVPFPAPTCEAEAVDDECRSCLKQNCCDVWLACDDATCAGELVEVSECVQEIEFATSDDLGMCISETSTAVDGLVQPNTLDLIDCALAPAGEDGLETLCSLECFGSDIFLE